MGKKTLLINPVTRIEGHGKITIQLDEQGKVSDARFHVTQIRGFEKLCEGRPFYEMPSLMARICGICPVSHLVASAKACDAILATRNGQQPSRPITEEELAHHLYTAELPDPDLLIRTSGEMRVSNFLLWQIAYAEIFVTETLWPDFNRARLLEALLDYQKRERRYGAILPSASAAR